MSLFINNGPTQKQKDFLVSLDYCGSWDITKEEAAQLIDELLNDQRIANKQDYNDDPFDHYDDPIA